MPVPDKVYLSTPSDTPSEAPGVSGEIREHIHATYGKQFYRMVKNDTGSSIGANLAVVYDCTGISADGVKVTKSAANAPAATVAGITQNAIADGKWGWVVCGGTCLATADDAVDISTLSTAITGSTAGELNDTAVSGNEHCIIGIFLEDKAGTGTVQVRLSGLM
tara:strand:- start:117 stop:608 length:492 start_codon:yes stop_codon:yes gene_type:complete